MDHVGGHAVRGEGGGVKGLGEWEKGEEEVSGPAAGKEECGRGEAGKEDRCEQDGKLKEEGA